jgi:16S rRNA (uracil1498-N3)-methyltransferase
LIALPKTGFDEVVRQCVELGAKTIVPVISERTLLQPSESKQKRWQRIAQEAAEQCERNTVPIVSPVLPLIPALAQVSPEDDRYICVTRIAAVSFLTRILSPDPPAKNQLAQNRSIAIVTGPEGGWTSAEVTAAIDLGYEPVSLGNLILRAVTAPIAVMSLVMAASSTTPTFPSCSERSELPSA